MDMDLETQTQQQFVPGSATTTTNPITCSTLDSLLSFSCRARAESFARKLQLKLKNLGVNGTEQSAGQTLLMMKPSESIPSAKQYYAELSSEIPDQHIVYSNNNNVTFQVMTGEATEELRVNDDTSTTKATTIATTAAQEQGSSSSSDSDYYFDFDIGSPGSPIENGSCYTVINPCDDLYCKECAGSTTCTRTGGVSSCQSQSNSATAVGTNYENGIESGCVVSSPASTSSTSPDNNFSSEHNKTLNVNGQSAIIPEQEPPEIVLQDEDVNGDDDDEEEENTREGSLDIPDGCSDASDSIYYDVESFSSPSISSSPKEMMLSSTATNIINDSSFETASEEEASTSVDAAVEPLCILVQSASLDSIDATLSQTDEVANTETTKQLNESNIEGGNKTGLTVDVTQASLRTEYEPQLLSPSSDDEFSNRHRIQRSSSLKTGKTPPGTPGRKKIVRFADVLGLDLADVRTFLDEIPNVPKSAFDDLKDAMEQAGISDPSAIHPRFIKPNKTLLPSFHQPVAMPDYFDKIRDQKVLLENAYLVEDFTIKGTVRVKNMDFHKSVYIRYTYNDWRNFTDFMTTYVSGSCDGFSDKFEFTIPLSPNSIDVGSRVSFACRFHCQGQQFWDNNCGRNYIFHCVPSSSQGQQNHLDYHLQSPSSDNWSCNRMW